MSWKDNAKAYKIQQLMYSVGEWYRKYGSAWTVDYGEASPGIISPNHLCEVKWKEKRYLMIFIKFSAHNDKPNVTRMNEFRMKSLHNSHLLPEDETFECAIPHKKCFISFAHSFVVLGFIYLSVCICLGPQIFHNEFSLHRGLSEF